MAPGDITLRLKKEEALVLFEWLANLNSLAPPIFQHPAEEMVLWRLESLLESILVEPFYENYLSILAEARKTVETEGA